MKQRMGRTYTGKKLRGVYAKTLPAAVMRISHHTVFPGCAQDNLSIPTDRMYAHHHSLKMTNTAPAIMLKPRR